MKLIKTNDGLFGWILNDKMIWCDTRQELYSIGWHHVAKRKDAEEYTEFCKDVDYAIDTMTQRNDDQAEFGVFGTFMYSTKEEASEF
jgi:hypothetical protein